VECTEKRLAALLGTEEGAPPQSRSRVKGVRAGEKTSVTLGLENLKHKRNQGSGQQGLGGSRKHGYIW